MSPKAKTRNESKPARALNCGLLRLPENFSWQCLRSLCSVASNSYDCQPIVDLTRIARKQDAAGYHSWAKQFSLQRLADLGPLPPYKMAVLRLLAVTGKRTYSFETIPARQRSAEAIELSMTTDRFVDRGFLNTDVGLEARNQIRQLLGPFEWCDAYQYARHGPGATVEPRVPRNAYAKYASWPYAVTTKGRSILSDAIRSDPRWYGALEASYREVNGIQPWELLRANWLDDCIVEIDYNRVITVPKDGTKDRTIAIEPLGSMYLQLGVEGVLRRYLRAWNIDLNDQSPNRQGALEGSLQPFGADTLCTLDLSSASDRISSDLVRGLLPPDWFDALDALRSPRGLLPNRGERLYSRFSSMGNGYTFALQSLIYASILRAIIIIYGRGCGLSRIRVFGDDCLYPGYMHKHVLCYFEGAGFVVNHDKTFAAGSPIRESCGKEFYYGHDISAPRMPEIWDSLESLVSYRNQLYVWSESNLGSAHEMRPVLDLLDRYVAVPLDYRPQGEAVSSETAFLFGENVVERGGVAVRVRKAKKPPEFLFGRLMHDLASCESDRGTRFDTTRGEAGALRLVTRTLCAL